MKAMVNGSRDAGMCGELKPFIGKLVNVIKQKKNGLYLCELNENPSYVESIPKYNLDFISDSDINWNEYYKSN